MIQARNIVKRYGDIAVLRGIDIDIEAGAVTSIVGASGAGKTTLLQVLGTLTAPDSGKVIYDGEDVSALSDARLSRFRNAHIGFVFQFHRLLPEFTLTENVAMPALIAGVAQRKAFERANAMIHRLGLDSRATHKPGELSGGECQRAAVARALINNPKVVLADEPSGSLDSHNKALLHRLFFELRDELGSTFVIVTHDEHLAADCDHVITMADGLITGAVANTAKHQPTISV